MFALLGKWFVIVALIASVGGHWAFLQGVAWTGMAISYTKQASLSVALKKTFDGKNPCNLCKVISAGKKAEKQAEPLEVKKLDAFVLASGAIHFERAPLARSTFVVRLDEFPSTPPSPPPRLA